MTWQDPSGSETARQLEDMEVATNGLKAGDTDSGEERKNSNTSIRTIQSTPKYTECMGADKPFANISNRRMMDNITRAVLCFVLAYHIFPSQSNQGVQVFLERNFLTLIVI